jgi:hypothetical protein
MGARRRQEEEEVVLQLWLWLMMIEKREMRYDRGRMGEVGGSGEIFRAFLEQKYNFRPKKCFSTLIYCGLTCGCTLILICL